MSNKDAAAIINLCASLRKAGVTYDAIEENEEIVLYAGDVKGWFAGLNPDQKLWISTHTTVEVTTASGTPQRVIRW